MKQHVVVLTVVGMVCGLTLAVAQAQPGDAHWRERGGRPGRPSQAGMRGEQGGLDEMRQVISSGWMLSTLTRPETAADLELTEEQVTSIQAEVEQMQQDQKTIQAELQASAMEQARLLTGETFDEEALMAVVEETGRLRTELAKLRIQPLLILRRTLTAEQIEKAHAIMAEQRHGRSWSRDRSRSRAFGDRQEEQAQSLGEEAEVSAEDEQEGQ